MKKLSIVFLSLVLVSVFAVSCASTKKVKIGVAFGVGPAVRWAQEIKYMQEYAQTLNAEIVVRHNTDEKAKPIADDCKELIDSGIDVLIVRPRDVSGMKEVVDYAHKNKVKVISYDSLIENEKVDLFIGYDSENTGQRLGRYLSETVTSGDYIMIWGDMNKNVEEMRKGAMKYLEPLKGQINIILEASAKGWSPEEAKRIIKEAVEANGGKIDAIMAFNDKLAEGCAEALKELGIAKPYIISGIDAELNAVKRILDDTQACTAFMDIKELSHKAIEEAINLAKNNKLNSNSEMENKSGAPIPSLLLSRQFVNKTNIDRVLIDSGYYTKEQVYGE